MGLTSTRFPIHQGFVSPDAQTRQRNINHTVHCIRLAHELGIPSIRLNSGRWGTIQSFDELMKTEGQEPTLPGHTEDEAFDWVIASIEECLPDAERYGVVLGLENHWGLTCTPEGVNRIVSALDSDWLKVTMDCGNFLSDPYDKLQQIVSEAVLVHAKTYYGGGEWYTLDLDYVKIGEMLRTVDFQGYISIEFEGKEEAHTGVPQSVEMLRNSPQSIGTIKKGGFGPPSAYFVSQGAASPTAGGAGKRLTTSTGFPKSDDSSTRSQTSNT